MNTSSPSSSLQRAMAGLIESKKEKYQIENNEWNWNIVQLIVVNSCLSW